ncbi:MAG: hypothetical protein ACPL68_03440, partial [Candidatus Hydrothermia bacterium]
IAPAVKTMATQGFIGWLNGFIGSGIGVWTGRLFMVAVAVLFAIMINSAWRGRRSQNNGGAS